MTPKEEKKFDNKVQKVAKKARLHGIVGLIAIIIFFSIYSVVKFNHWSQTNRFQWPVLRSPVIFQNPVVEGVISKRVISPIILDAKTPEIANNGQISPTTTPLSKALDEAYKTIHFHETGYGQNKTGLNGYCIENKLGINEVGYAPQDKYCFKDAKEQEETVKLWLTNRLTGKKPGICSDMNHCLKVYSDGAYSYIYYE